MSDNSSIPAANGTQTVNFDVAKRERLRKQYNEAVRDGHETFTFEGNEYLAAYAKYLLQYLDGQLGR